MSFPSITATIYLPTGATVTSYATAFDIQRGRSSLVFDEIDAASGVVTLNNEDRRFDPLNASGPYYGYLVPGCRVSLTAAGVTVFDGYAADWSYEYSVDGRSLAVVRLEDGLARLGRQTFDEWNTTYGDLPGDRFAAIIARPEVDWAGSTSFDTGAFYLDTDLVTWGSNVLNYCQLVARTDMGYFFVDRSGVLTFKDRLAFSGVASAVSFGTGGVAFHEITTSYGVEQLFNKVTLGRVGGVDPVTVSDATSITAYGGVFAYSYDGLLMQDDTQLEALATQLLAVYKDPIYRFESILVKTHALTGTDQTGTLGLDIGDVVSVTWTPNDTGSAIARTCIVEGVRHSASADRTYTVELTLNDSSVVQAGSLYTVDDATYGYFDGGGTLEYPVAF